MTLQHSLLPALPDAGPELTPATARDLTKTEIQRIQASLDHSVSDNTRARPDCAFSVLWTFPTPPWQQPLPSV